MVTEELENKLRSTAKALYPNDWNQVFNASIDWVDAKCTRAMSGRGESDKLFKQFTKNYSGDVQSAAIEVVNEAEYV